MVFLISSYILAVNHLVNTASLGHSFYFEDAIDTSIFPHLMVDKMDKNTIYLFCHWIDV